MKYLDNKKKPVIIGGNKENSMYASQLESMTELVAKALDISIVDPRFDKIRAALNKYWEDKFAITWTINDIASLDCADGLSDKDLLNILNDLGDNLDSSVGVTWDAIETAVHEYKSKCNTD